MARKSEAPKFAEPEDGLTPRANPKLFGHTATEAMLLDAWKQGRLPHAIILAGEKGIGKATLAFRFARYVLSGGGEGAAPAQAEEAPPSLGLFDLPPIPAPAAAPLGDSLEMDPDHPVFRRVAAGGHPDLLVVSPAFDVKKGEYKREIAVDDTREIGHFLSLTPSESQWRVVIIDAADEMNRNAANAILKVLEEPPPRAVLLLISHRPGALLPTIRSRCRLVKLPPHGLESFAQVVTYVHPEIAAGDLPALQLLSGGSPGRASGLYAIGAKDMYGQMLALLEGYPRINPLKLHQLCDQLTGKDAAKRWPVATELLLLLLARIIPYGMNEAGLSEILPGERAVLQRLGSAHPLDSWVRLWEKAGQMIGEEARLNLDKKQTLLSIFHALESPNL